MSPARLPIGKPLAWALAACVILGLPATSWIYWPAIGQAGVLPPEADTIMIPMVGSVVFAVGLLPVVWAITWLCLRGSDDAGNLIAWDSARPLRSTAVTACFLIPFCTGVWALLEEFTAPSEWHGQWWLPYTLITLCWLAVMRGAALTERNGS